ncbi:hypothetical protein MCUN1_003728 [Malassezia cuniculi]|uniref:RRM domain-containing protein n=1 Tax=Malassezia cuniculi TaxID=948313 RepID=A0AAF0J825_9BASI|nr:hypothetical protein MCUN1_003728 [Malassezia cuniculi]
MAPPAHLDTSDPAVHFDQQQRLWIWEEENGDSWEWHSRDGVPEDGTDASGHWLPVVAEEDIHKQQQIYAVEGVDESEPAAPVLLRQQGKKRKQSEETERKPRPVTAVFVAKLPLDATADEIASVFSRYGVLLEDDEGKPRIKLYHDEQTGMFKGEALVVYYKPESVDLAIRLLDDTHLRAHTGNTSGPNMEVQKAEFKEQPKDAEQHKTLSEEDKKKIRRRMNKMHNKVTEWESPDENEGPSEKARTLILKKMFTLAELDQDPTLIVELKQDVREECELLGKVNSVVLWDLEPEGIISVKFADPLVARACLKKMDGRFFAGRRIAAFLIDGRPRFRRSGRGDESEEEQRTAAFGEWLESRDST